MVRVVVAEGALEGEKLNNEYGGQFYSFKGIPYAEPPVGELRFKAPIPKRPWPDVRLAKEHGPHCYQKCIFTPSTTTEPTGSEDCLYLNVYTPEITPSELFPVMVYIHGGGFLDGSGNDETLGPEFLVKNDVILVTINYRLEVIGFLCLDTEDIPGNAGMKDQVAALRWVQNNIRNFGGDANNVTIFGQSAGAASVSYHLVSSMSKGLFKRAIMQSGTMLCPWAHTAIGRDTALALARDMGCESEDDSEIYDFFKNLPIENLIMKQLSLTYAVKTKRSVNITFPIVSEKKFNNEAFFTGDVHDAVRRGIHENVEVMNGYTEDEATVAFAVGLKAEAVYDQTKMFYEFFVPKTLSFYCSTRDQLEIGKRMKEFYLKGVKSREKTLEEILRFLGMDYFKYCASLWQKIAAERNENKLYYYKFTYHSERNIFANIFKAGEVLRDKKIVSHCDELPYMFPYKAFMPKVQTDSETYKMIETVTKLWTNFAKYGNPTPDNSLNAKWEPFTIEKQHYLEIGEKIELKTNLDKDEVDFWENIFREYFPQLAP